MEKNIFTEISKNRKREVRSLQEGLKMITIGNPYIIYAKNKARLVSDFIIDGTVKKVWIETALQYKEGLCTDYSDGFLIAILPYAMINRHNIVIDGKITTDIFFNLTHYTIPFLNRLSNGEWKQIKIKSNYDRINRYSGKHVGTGISCGIDSLSTIKYHFDDEEMEEYRLDTLVLLNAGFYGYDEASHSRSQKYVKQAEEFAAEKKLPMIFVDSNVAGFYDGELDKWHTWLCTGIILMMQNYFSKYYMASAGYPYELSMDIEDDATYDLYLLNTVSNFNLSFISGCHFMLRNDKTQYLLLSQEYRKHIYVCTSEYSGMNCGRCKKCIRTLLDAESIGQIDSLSERFHIDYFKKHTNSYWGYALRRRRDHYYPNTIRHYKQNGGHIGLKAYINAVLPNQFDKFYYTKLIYHKLEKRRLIGIILKYFRRIAGK